MILNVNTKPLNSYGVPNFTYTGTYEIVDDNDNPLTGKAENWKIRFLTSGDLTFTKLNGANKGIDAFIVGGGGTGSPSGSGYYAGGGGGGGYIKFEHFISLEKNTVYKITVGGSAGNSSAFSITAECGKSGGLLSGGGEGTGKGGTGGYYSGSKNGTNGQKGRLEFDIGPKYYGGGGGGGASYTPTESATMYGNPGSGGAGGGGKGGNYGAVGQAGAVNTGGGGGGSGAPNSTTNKVSGGSGIVIIRNARKWTWDGLFEATATTQTNVRSTPQVVSSPSNVVGSIKSGSKVTIYELSAGLNSDTNTWGKIIQPTFEGWIALSNYTYKAYCLISDKDGANLYSSKDSSGTPLVNLPENTEIYVEDFSHVNRIIWAKTTISIDGISYSGYLLYDKITIPSEKG